MSFYGIYQTVYAEADTNYDGIKELKLKVVFVM